MVNLELLLCILFGKYWALNRYLLSYLINLTDQFR